MNVRTGQTAARLALLLRNGGVEGEAALGLRQRREGGVQLQQRPRLLPGGVPGDVGLPQQLLCDTTHQIDGYRDGTQQSVTVRRSAYTHCRR